MSLPRIILLKAEFKLADVDSMTIDDCIEEFRNGVHSFSGVYKNAGPYDEPEKAIYVKQGTKRVITIAWKDDIEKWQASNPHKAAPHDQCVLESDGDSPNKLPKFFVNKHQEGFEFRKLYRVFVDFDTQEVIEQLNTVVKRVLESLKLVKIV